MADNTTDTEYVSTAMDYKAHEATYRNFISIVKWSIGLIVVALVVLYFLINP